MSDLIHILKLQQKAPLTKADIIEAIEKMVDEFEGQEKYIKFFLNVQSKLLKDKDFFLNYDEENKKLKSLEKDWESKNEELEKLISLN